MSDRIIRHVTLVFKGGHILDVLMKQSDAYDIRDALMYPDDDEFRRTLSKIQWVGAPNADEDVLDRQLTLNVKELLYILY
jgi:hypothetical protein